MNMVSVVITQPMLFPWAGFFEQLAIADHYVYLEDVQFSFGSFTNRIQIKLRDDRKWMTIPLVGGGKFQNIIDLKPSGDTWKGSHRALLIQSLRSYPYRDDAIAIFDAAYTKSDLQSLLIESIEAPARYMQIGQRRTVRQTVDMNIGGSSWRRVLDIVQRVGGDRYLTGLGAAKYLDHQAFERANVAVEYMKYGDSSWPQQGATFTRYVTILDLIAAVGPRAADFLQSATVPWREFLAMRGIPVDAGATA